MTVAALFVRRDSIYKQLPGVDAWDADRDARNWPGGQPVVAHPPCRAWGRFRQWVTPRPGEKELAPWAVEQVRTHGGVLEHPERSSLWPAVGLPLPGERDWWGGWTLPIAQYWFGHRAMKMTWLYVVGVPPRNIPPFPIVLGESTHVIARHRNGAGNTKGCPRWRPEVSRREREHTPEPLARWLVDLARSATSPAASWSPSA